MFFSACQKVQRVTKITTDELTITNSDVLIEGTIIDISDVGVDYYGHCWSTSDAPIAPNTAVSTNQLYTINENAVTGNSFTSQLHGIEFNTEYYVRSYAVSVGQIYYGEEKTFIIIDNSEITTNNYFISGTTATLTGEIISIGFLPVTDHGHCWSTTSTNPTINDNILSIGAASALGVFHTFLNNLSSGTTYYYRSYAIKFDSTINYGSINSFSF